MKHAITLFVFLFTFQITVHAICTLPAPAGFQPENVASCSFGVKWNPVNGAVSYNLKYKLSSASVWTTINLGNVTSYTVTGLLASTEYKAKVAPVCSNGEEGTYSYNVIVTTITCSTPQNLSVSLITSSSAQISWAPPCGETSFKLRWREVGTTAWTTANNLSATSYTITNLQELTTYQVKVQSKCAGSTTSAFTKVLTFTTLSSGVSLSGKNVLLIIVDDARFDTYEANNGPEFFSDANISRIANEGVNFKVSFPALSMCAPSRASIATGVYPHIHGITDNPHDGITDSITMLTLPEILDDNGYYTGLIGKWHINDFPQPGYDYWLQCDKNDYFDARYNYFLQTKKILGHQTDILTDSAIAFLHKVPEGQPFFLWLGYRAPHVPYDSRYEDTALFDNDTMPFPSNFEEYEENFPGFVYTCHSAPDSANLVEDYRGYFEMLNGVNTRLGDVFAEMEAMGIMDSTLIIFMSDNGFLMGEHGMLEKQLAYEESIKIPLFMRYPKLINAGKLVKKQMAMNIDIAPTILDFADIPNTFNMQGVSLFDLMNGDVTRTEFLYQFFNKDCVPDIRGVRSLNNKYVQYNCNDITEEFFDLNNDKKENHNEIFNSAYADSIQVYKDKLTYWRNYYEDFTWDSLYTCSLSNIQRINQGTNELLTLLNVFPNPAHDAFHIHFISEEKSTSTVMILNATGERVYEVTRNEEETEFLLPVPTAGLSAGNYFAVVQHGKHTFKQAFVVQ